MSKIVCKIKKHSSNDSFNEVFSSIVGDYLKINSIRGYKIVLKNNYCEEFQRNSISLSLISRKNLQITLDDEVYVSVYTQGVNKLKKATFVVKQLGRPEQNLVIDNKVVQDLLIGIPVFNNQEIAVKCPINHHNYILTFLYKTDEIQQLPSIVTKETQIKYETDDHSGSIIIQNDNEEGSQIDILGLNLEEEGIGGLGEEFERVFKEAFITRAYPPNVIKEMGIKHLKGMILYGPSGCGKTIFARQLSKILQKNSGKEAKIINGPELLDSYIGSSEKNVRQLFSEAISDQKKLGDKSSLHVIIFDEFDAIASKRSSGNDAGSRVSNGIVNQLLSMIDGVNQLNNILVIGMTNRLDMIDTALLRSGRFGLHLHVKMPDVDGRKQILRIHTKCLRLSNRLSEDVDLDKIAELTENYTGADLEALVQQASSSSLKRNLTQLKLIESKIESELISDKITVNMNDFMKSIDLKNKLNHQNYT